MTKQVLSRISVAIAFLLVVGGLINVTSWQPVHPTINLEPSTQRLALYSPEITWSLDIKPLYGKYETASWRQVYGDDYDDSQDAETTRIENYLTSRDGWRRAGVDFTYNQYDSVYPQPPDQPQPFRPMILIYEVYPAELQKKCGIQEWACTLPSKYSCTIWLGVNAVLDSEFHQGNDGWLEPHVINHEIGHCLGFAHTPGTLMAKYADLNNPISPYPTAPEIAWVRARVLATLPDQFYPAALALG